MNKHMRLVVSVLFIVVILLAVAITKFYSDTGKTTGGKKAQNDIERRLDSDSAGNRIFEDSKGFFGVIDSSDRIIVPAEWIELSFAGRGKCIASKRIGGKVMKGCVDLDGNVVVPLIYSSITAYKNADMCLYSAQSSADGSIVIYDADFQPLFRKVWNECSFSGGMLSLKSGDNVYTYSADSSGLTFVKAQLSGETMGVAYSFSSDSTVLLAGLDPEMLEKISDGIGDYLRFAYTGDRSGGFGDQKAFAPLFPEDKKIISKKLTGIGNIFIFPVKSEDKNQHFGVSFSADTAITYKKDVQAGTDGETAALSGKYKAQMEFAGSIGTGINVLSGRFELSEPEYPEDKPEDDEEEGL